MYTKKFFVIFILLLVTVAGNTKSGKGAIGIIAGDPTGVSGRIALSESSSLNLALGYSFLPAYESFAMHADYVTEFNTNRIEGLNFPFYLGYGMRIRNTSKNEFSLGARGVAGILIRPNNLPVEFFLELAPVFEIFPATKLKLDAGLGVRYQLE